MRAAVMLFLLTLTAQAAPKLLRFSAEGPWLRMVHDGYDWQGRYWDAHIRRDGHVELKPRPQQAGISDESVNQEKRWFLDETTDMRNDLADEERARLVRYSLDTLPSLLAEVWSDPEWSAEERREILFKIWDEASEPDDPELGKAGEKARALIDRFVRQQLPAWSPNGFSAGELAQLNLRRAHGPRFAPYHGGPDVDRP